MNGEERFIEWDIEDGGTYQEIPKWLYLSGQPLIFWIWTPGMGEIKPVQLYFDLDRK